jgi:hypothetical protein
MILKLSLVTAVTGKVWIRYTMQFLYTACNLQVNSP